MTPLGFHVGDRGMPFTHKEKGWTNPYVTDGLVAMWDGEWNDGPGKHHDDTTRPWVELCGTGCDLTYSSVAEIHDMYGTTGLESTGANLARNISRKWFDFSSGEWTYEAAIDVQTLNQCAILALDGGTSYAGGAHGLNASTSLTTMMFNHQSATPACNYAANRVNFFAARVSGGTVTSPVFVGGVESSIKGYAQNIYGRGVSFGSPASDYWMERGYIYTKFYCVRVYNRALTAEEIAANYEIDKARFHLEEGPLSSRLAFGGARDENLATASRSRSAARSTVRRPCRTPCPSARSSRSSWSPTS